MQSIRPLFLTRAKFEEISEPLHITQKLRTKGAAITEPEAERFLDWIVYEARKFVLKAKIETFNEKADPHAPRPDMTTDYTAGECSFTQCIAGYAMQDRGLNPVQMAAQDIKNHTIGHAMQTVPLPLESGTTHYLVDPTYRQFCDPSQPTFSGDERFKKATMPGYLLEKEEGGPAIVEKLMRDGHIKLTPDIAQKYLASFTGGNSTFNSPDQALDFMKKEPEGGKGYFGFGREPMKVRGFMVIVT
ncbi:MAG TPA: hypothetical protein VGE06_04135 [Flavisolibacter sp.]